MRLAALTSTGRPSISAACGSEGKPAGILRMNIIYAEMLYFQRRLDATQAMVDAAAGPCARRAHELLARLYGEVIAALSVQAASLVEEPVRTFAKRGVRTAPRTLRPTHNRAHLMLKLAS
jgi:hypothetical protein